MIDTWTADFGWPGDGGVFIVSPVGAAVEELYAVATANRLLAADMFAGLSEEQWRTPSLCAGWTVREIAAHLVPPAEGFPLWRVALRLIRFRGDLDRLVDESTREQARRPVGELVADLRERASMRLTPPMVGAGGPMADSAIHLRDAARPLNLSGVNPAPPAWRPVLDFLVSKPARHAFLPPDRLTGLRLETTDQDWTWGDGAQVRGTSEAVALALAGRDVVLPELSGPGVATLAGRLGGR
jgi:uncharacterized protein (TIGR03083 family)